MKRFVISSRSGQSLMEVLIAIAVGSFLVIGAATIIVPVLKISKQAGQSQTGMALAKELSENVRVWSEGDWHNLMNLATTSLNHYYLITSVSPFTLISGDEAVLVSTTTYKRYFYIDDVLRGAGGNISSSTGVSDPSTKLVTLAYSWPGSSTNTMSVYLTRNRDNIFSQTDWFGGPGQDGPSTNVGNKFSASTNIDYTTSPGSIMIKL